MRTIFFIFGIVFKKWKNRKIAYRSPNFPLFHFNKTNENMTSVPNNFLFFLLFLINRKTLKRYTISDSFSFFILLKNGTEKWEVMNI